MDQNCLVTRVLVTVVILIFQNKEGIKPKTFPLLSSKSQETGWPMGSSVIIEPLTSYSHLAEWREKCPHLAAVCCPICPPHVRADLRSLGHSPCPGTWADLQPEKRARALREQRAGLYRGLPGLAPWADMEARCQEGEEEWITAPAAAAERVGDRLGDPAVSSVTNIPGKIKSQEASLFFVWRFMYRLCHSPMEADSPRSRSPSVHPGSLGWLPAASRLPGGVCYSQGAVLKDDLLSLLNQCSPPKPAACCGNEFWPAARIKPIFAGAAVNSISSLSSFLSPRPVPPFGVEMKAETCWEKQCSALFAG